MNLSPISAKTKSTPVPNPPQNYLGRPRQVRDDNNQLVWQLTPTDFGGLVDKALQDKTGYALNLRFAGQYHDSETGYHYNYHRDYDPKVGRYLTSDPIGLNGGSFNTYAYVENEVWGNIDPYGLIKWKGTSLGGSLVAGGGGIYEYYTLWSECIGGRKGFARVKTFGSAVGFGATIGGGGGSVVLEDGRDDFDLNVFNGQYKKSGYGFGFGLTVGGALIQLGEARTDLSSLSPSLGAGWDNSIIGTVGWSKVVTGRVTVCGCS